jgi:uncharacterized protein (DUF2141 family)
VIPLCAQSAKTGTLTVVVRGAKNTKGKLGLGVFRDVVGFPEDHTKMVARQRIEIDPQSLSGQAVFRDLAYGVYAVSVLHDENVNGKLDKNLIGVPKEGYGVSNNPKPVMRAPRFEEAKLALNSSEQSIEIHLVYR